MLKNLNKAIKENPSPDLIVWPETSVIPSIIYKTNNVNTDIETRKFLNDVLSFIDEKDVSFVIGNNHTEYDFSKNEIDHYSNAALFFSRNQSAYDLQPQIYEKQHLVPFTEIAPFKKVFPSIANKIENQFGYSYKPGKGPVVFQEKELYFWEQKLMTKLQILLLHSYYYWIVKIRKKILCYILTVLAAV